MEQGNIRTAFWQERGAGKVMGFKGRNQSAVLNHLRPKDQSDWLDVHQIQRRIAHNRFQIQMEEVTPYPEQSSSQCLSSSDAVSSCSGSSIDQQHCQMIYQLLALKLPIFTVSECRQLPRDDDFSRQEMLKQKILSYNRKEKSLEELSKKFIERFQGKDGIVLELDRVTIQLQVERRRIYDIVNIFESLRVVKKASKNNYVWRGLTEAVQTISLITSNGCEFEDYTSKKEKSLENLAARFLKVFIFSNGPVSLQQAAKILISTDDSALIKTKIRRLYDIINVFKSIGIVRKVRLHNKKPAFQWAGIKNLQNIIEDKKVKVEPVSQTKLPATSEKENCQIRCNKEDVNSWFSSQDQKSFLDIPFFKRYSQRSFEPSILKSDAVSYTLAGSLESISDICA